MSSEHKSLLETLQKRAENYTVTEKMTQRGDSCSCVKEDGEYGERGWHWKVNPAYPDSPQLDSATERCPHYDEAVNEKKAPF